MLGGQKCALFAKQTFLWILKSWTMRAGRPLRISDDESCTMSALATMSSALRFDVNLALCVACSASRRGPSSAGVLTPRPAIVVADRIVGRATPVSSSAPLTMAVKPYARSPSLSSNRYVGRSSACSANVMNLRQY